MITKKIRTHSRMNVRVRQSEKNSNLESINAIEAETSHLDPVEEYYDWQEKVSIALVVSLDRVTELLAVLYQFDADYQPLEPREGEKGVLVDPPGPMPSIDQNSEVVTRALQLINPPEARSVVCRKEIASVISVLILLDRYFAGVPTAGQSRKELNNAIEALINANNAIRAMTRISQPLSYIVRQPFWNAVSKLLDQITAAMKLHKERIIVGHGHQSPNFAKSESRLQADL